MPLMHACCSADAGPERREVAGGHRLLVAALLDRGDVERRQQVHGVDAGIRELAQLVGARRVARERTVRAALRLGHRLVGDREVAHVQLVDRAVDRAARPRARASRPTGSGCSESSSRFTITVRAEFVVRATEYGSVTELTSIFARRRCVDLDRPAVLVADRGAVDAPRAVGRVELGGDDRRVAGRAGVPDLERHRLRGRRPEAHRRVQAGHGRAERRRGERVGVEVVEHAGQLHAGERR